MDENQRKLLKEVSANISSIPLYSSAVDYNMFHVLGVEGKEVIMCRFLADLLDPNGFHKKGIIFLRMFLEKVLGVNGLSDQLLLNTIVAREYAIDTDRRIDIAIYNYKFFIPIEVKIYAGEQKNQCFDYYEYASKHCQETKIVYLTRFASEPSVYSRKTLSILTVVICRDLV